MSLLKVENVSKEFAVPKPGAWFGNARLMAVDGVSLELEAGKVLGIVGESGSGKSTLGKMIMALEEPSVGRVLFEGQDLFKLGGAELRHRRRDFQMVFQDPMASLNPRHRVGEIVGEPLMIHDKMPEPDALEHAGLLLEEVGLDKGMLGRFPHEFSGGQRQRIMIARAIATRPKLLVADEPVSSLDLTVQAQILELLITLKLSHRMAMVFISHDLRIVERLSDQVAVMKDGKIIEAGPAKEIYRHPRHEYTKALLEAGLPLPSALMSHLRKTHGQS
jgi:ABC-type microcin C transport system duplicated ATPase subunit YejF